MGITEQHWGAQAQRDLDQATGQGRVQGRDLAEEGTRSYVCCCFQTQRLEWFLEGGTLRKMASGNSNSL